MIRNDFLGFWDDLWWKIKKTGPITDFSSQSAHVPFHDLDSK
jgi:hypothetical protein